MVFLPPSACSPVCWPCEEKQRTKPNPGRWERRQRWQRRAGGDVRQKLASGACGPAGRAELGQKRNWPQFYLENVLPLGAQTLVPERAMCFLTHVFSPATFRVRLNVTLLLPFRIESSDLPLLAAVASTHSPYVAQILL